MKIEDFKKDYYEFSKQTSSLVRQFAFAGIAIIWIFKFEKPYDHIIPIELFPALFFLVVTLICDLLQYLVPTIIWSVFFRIQEKKHSGNSQADVKASPWLSVPGWLFFFCKIVGLSIGFYFILQFLIYKI